MLNHLVGHIVGLEHQFPEIYAKEELNEDYLVDE